VEQVSDGGAVLEWARRGLELELDAPDVVVFDVHMPSLTGVDLLAEMRRAGCMTPVILVTALPDDEIRQAVAHCDVQRERALVERHPEVVVCVGSGVGYDQAGVAFHA
jgi:CheY-like chemotaxis protein